jgi:hypothetical protein
MRNKLLLCLAVLAASAIMTSCVKSTTLPVYTPPEQYVFYASTLAHTKDTVNVGDTIQLKATGYFYDTTKTISAFVTSSFTGTASGTFSYGTAAAPIKLTRTATYTPGFGYYWTATIPVIGATAVAHKSTLTLSATFVYQLSLSSELPASLTYIDGAPATKAKTIYVK